MLSIFTVRFALQGHQTLNTAHLDLLFWVAPTFRQASNDTTTRRVSSLRWRFLPLSQIGLHDGRCALFLRFAERLHQYVRCSIWSTLLSFLSLDQVSRQLPLRNCLMLKIFNKLISNLLSI